MNLKQALAFAEDSAVIVSPRKQNMPRHVEWYQVGEAFHIEKPMHRKGQHGVSWLWTIFRNGEALLDPANPSRPLRMALGDAVEYAVRLNLAHRRMSIEGIKPSSTLATIGDMPVKPPKLVFEMRVSKGGKSMTVYVSGDNLDSAMENTRAFFENPTITFVRGVEPVLGRRVDLEF